jgi:mono/diheme cytochrome c family protein
MLYDQNCALCHGRNGEGRVGATLAKNFPSIRPDLRIKSTIERGIEGSVMPAWAQDYGGPLSATEINDLVAFLLTWSTPPYPPSITETPALAYTPFKILQSQPVAVLVFTLVVVVVLAAVFALLRHNMSKR